MKVKGKVVKKIFGKGSKSEHDAVMLVTADGEYKLRREQGNPFHDPELEKLVGKTIHCDGVSHDYTFIMSKFEELQEAFDAGEEGKTGKSTDAAAKAKKKSRSSGRKSDDEE